MQSSLLSGRLEVCVQRKLPRFLAGSYALLLGALLLSFCVKVGLIHSRDLWSDETYSAFVARLPFVQLIRFTAGDVHPPLYYLLLSGWVRLVGDAKAQLRLFSVLLNIASIVPFFFLARRSLGARFGTYATVLFAFSPMVLVYSLEARSYMLFLFLFLCLLLVHWKVVIEANTSKSIIALYGTLAAMLFYVHYISVFILTGLFLHWLLQPGRDRSRLLRIGAAGLFTIMFASPGIPVLLSQRAQKTQLDQALHQSQHDPVSLSFKGEIPEKINFALALVRGATVLSGFYPASSHLLTALTAIPLFIVLMGVGYLWLIKGDPVCRLFGFIAIAAVIGVVVLHLEAARYMLPLVPPLILALARVLQYWIAQARWRTAGAVIATAILSVYMAGFFRQAVRPHGQSWRNVVHIVQQSYQPGDEVVFDALYAQVPFDYFARWQHFHPRETGFPLSIYDWWGKQRSEAWGGPTISQTDLNTFVSSPAVTGSRTIWLVTYEAYYYDPHEALRAKLQTIGKVTEVPLPPEPIGSNLEENRVRLVRIDINKEVSSLAP